MKIQLNNVIPLPLQDQLNPTSTCWNTAAVLAENQRILVQAVSGKGKSTFVNSIYGIRKDFKGEILLNGISTKSISMDDWSEIRAKKIAVVFQDLQLIPHLTVAENLALKNDLTHHKTTAKQKAMVERVGLLEKWNVDCGILSYGQQQRIAIVRALLQPFEVILLDEPFAHLDEENSLNCYQLIAKEAQKNNATIVLTTLNNTKIDSFDQHLTL